MPVGTDVLDYERGQACAIQPDFWQTDTSISNTSWGFIEGDSYKGYGGMEIGTHAVTDTHRRNGGVTDPPPSPLPPCSAPELLVTMMDIVSKNGAMLLNVGAHATPCYSVP